MNAPATAPIRRAATVVLLRDTPAGAVETFLVRRHGQSGFMAGASVFPGGKVDPEDTRGVAAGLTPEACAARLDVGDPSAAWAIHVAAIRELHEEAHILLARRGDGTVATAADVAALDAALVGARSGHSLPSSAWHAAVHALDLTLALDLLHPFAHWLTPRAEPRRFDTWFFAAVQPSDQHAQLDLHEASDAFWRTPADARAEHASGGAILLPPPTFHTAHTLAALAPGATAAQVVAELARPGVGPCVEPHFAMETPEGPAIILPEDVGHPDHSTWQGARADVSRFLLIDGRFSWVRR